MTFVFSSQGAVQIVTFYGFHKEAIDRQQSEHITLWRVLAASTSRFPPCYRFRPSTHAASHRDLRLSTIPDTFFPCSAPPSILLVARVLHDALYVPCIAICGVHRPGRHAEEMQSLVLLRTDWWGSVYGQLALSSGSPCLHLDGAYLVNTIPDSATRIDPEFMTL